MLSLRPESFLLLSHRYEGNVSGSPSMIDSWRESAAWSCPHGGWGVKQFFLNTTACIHRAKLAPSSHVFPSRQIAAISYFLIYVDSFFSFVKKNSVPALTQNAPLEKSVVVLSSCPPPLRIIIHHHSEPYDFSPPPIPSIFRSLGSIYTYCCVLRCSLPPHIIWTAGWVLCSDGFLIVGVEFAMEEEYCVLFFPIGVEGRSWVNGWRVFLVAVLATSRTLARDVLGARARTALMWQV